VRTAPLASIYLSEQIAKLLRDSIQAGKFTLTEAVAPLPGDRNVLAQDSAK
jgi:uncharacterized protein (DUF39 family)